MIDKRDTFAPRRSVRPRHRATRHTPVLATAVSEVAYARPGGGKSGAPAIAGAVASGLVAASVGVLVTVLIATGTHGAPRVTLAAKGPTVVRSAAAKLPAPAHPRAARAHAARHPRHTAAHRATTAPVTSQPVHTTFQTSSAPPPFPATGYSFPGAGSDFWRQVAERYGATTWHSDTGRYGGYRWP